VVFHCCLPPLVCLTLPVGLCPACAAFHRTGLSLAVCLAPRPACGRGRSGPVECWYCVPSGENHLAPYVGLVASLRGLRCLVSSVTASWVSWPRKARLLQVDLCDRVTRLFPSRTTLSPPVMPTPAGRGQPRSAVRVLIAGRRPHPRPVGLCPLCCCTVRRDAHAR